MKLKLWLWLLSVLAILTFAVQMWANPPFCTGKEPPPFMIGGTRQAGCGGAALDR
jgi:hypothetical protein